jgi:hypothetical protein
MPSCEVYRPLAESMVITPSLRFEEFSEFYHNGYEPLKRDIVIGWGLAENMQGAYAYSAVDAHTGMDVIFLAQLPTDYVDAFLIAHEISHVILKACGLSYDIRVREGSPPGYEIVAQNIKSLLEDPIVDSCLQGTYGFDLLKFYLYKEIPCEREIINTNSDESIIDDISKLANTFCYAGKILKWELIDDDAAMCKWREYQLLHDRTYPNISCKGKELASLAISHGFDTPEKRKQLTGMIINRYNLQDILDIVEHQSPLDFPFWRS